MSGPVSLRLCCLAAMAPALTDASGQTKIHLPNSPPALEEKTSGCVTVNGGIHTTAVIDIASVKAKVTTNLTPDPKGSRGLLKPLQVKLQGNGGIYSIETLQTSFKDINELLSSKQLKQLSSKQDHQYQKVVGKKMNQPSNGNGPHENGNSLIKQNSVNSKSVNGHSDLGPINLLKLSNNHGSMPNVNNTASIQTYNNISKIDRMCRTNESAPSGSTSGIEARPSTTPVSVNTDTVRNSGHHSSDTDMCVDRTTTKSVELRPQDLIKDASRKEVLLEKRSQFLLRRLRRLQGKQLESHVRSQLKSFVEFQHQNLQTVASKAIRPFGDLQSTLLNSNDVKNLSTSNLVSLVRKLQASQPKMAIEANKKAHETKGVLVMDPAVSVESERKSSQLRTCLRHWNSTVDSDATESSSGGESCEEWEDCPVMNDNKLPTPLYKRAEWKWAVDRAGIKSRWTWLQAQVSDLEYRIRQQSEIHKTIRSSKGAITLGDPPAPTVRLTDLGQVLLDGASGVESSPANVTTLMINVTNQASKLSRSLGNCISPIVSSQDSARDSVHKGPVGAVQRGLNGFLNNTHSDLNSVQQSQTHSSSGVPCSSPVGPHGDASNAAASPDLMLPLDASCVAARCRPIRFYRKRKLLRTTGLHQLNHKAARVSSVKCQCYPPVMPCPLCGGRYNNTQTLDAEGMPIMEKVSLLDPSFHPVLSFPQEIALPVHFEALLKSGEWQSSKPQPKVTLRAIAAEKRRQKLLNAQLKEQARKRKKMNKTAAAMLLTSAKLRSKYEGKSPHKTSKKKVTTESRLRRKELKRRRAAQLAVAAFKKTQYLHDLDQDNLSVTSQTPTPSPQTRDPSGLSFSQSSSLREAAREARKKKNIENAYDINNIVIPYSMAASTRVEKLQYKEIQTPKWREVMDEETEAVAMETGSEENDDENEIETMTDEDFAKRHQKNEDEERKRFRSFITYPPVRRSRLSRESESNVDNFSPDSSMNEAGFLQASLPESTLFSQSFPFNVGREEGRRRSGSTSRRSISIDEHSRDTEYYDMYRVVKEPFVPREFPLSDDCYEEMKREQETCTESENQAYRRAKAMKLDEEMEFMNALCERSESPSAPISPATSGSTVDDIHDPEWNASRGDRRSSLSLKQAKR